MDKSNETGVFNAEDLRYNAEQGRTIHRLKDVCMALAGLLFVLLVIGLALWFGAGGDQHR